MIKGYKYLFFCFFVIILTVVLGRKHCRFCNDIYIFNKLFAEVVKNGNSTVLVGQPRNEVELFSMFQSVLETYNDSHFKVFKNINSIDHISLEKVEQPLIKKFPSFNLLILPNFYFDFEKLKQDLLLADISSKKLYIDLRGNRGGFTKNYMKLVSFLYGSEESSDFFQDYPSTIKSLVYRPLRERFYKFENKDQFDRFIVNIYDVEIENIPHLVAKHNLNVNLIYDENCMSACAFFLLDMESSFNIKKISNVKELDFAITSNPVYFELPESKIVLKLPTGSYQLKNLEIKIYSDIDLEKGIYSNEIGKYLK